MRPELAPLPPLLVGVAALAAAVELVLLRLATRTFVNIPGLERWSGPIGSVAAAGRIAYFVTVVLIVVLLVTACSRRFGRGVPAQALQAGAIIGFLATALVTRLEWLDTDASVVLSVVTLVVAGAASGGGIRRIPIIAFLIAVVTHTIATVAGLATGPTAGWLLAAELLALVAAVTAPLLAGSRPDGRSMAIGVGVGIIAAGAIAPLGSPVRILTLWAFGVTGSLPIWAYGLGMAAIVAAVVDAVGRRDVHLAAGLTLLLSAGVGIVSTYQSALALAGLVVLSDALSGGEASAAGRRGHPVMLEQAPARDRLEEPGSAPTPFAPVSGATLFLPGDRGRPGAHPVA